MFGKQLFIFVAKFKRNKKQQYVIVDLFTWIDIKFLQDFNKISNVIDGKTFSFPPLIETKINKTDFMSKKKKNVNKFLYDTTVT